MSLIRFIRWCLTPLRILRRRPTAINGVEPTVLGAHCLHLEPPPPSPDPPERWSDLAWGPHAASPAEIDAAQDQFNRAEQLRSRHPRAFLSLAHRSPPGARLHGTLHPM